MPTPERRAFSISGASSDRDSSLNQTTNVQPGIGPLDGDPISESVSQRIQQGLPALTIQTAHAAHMAFIGAALDEQG